jgi:hypothetical protein
MLIIALMVASGGSGRWRRTTDKIFPGTATAAALAALISLGAEAIHNGQSVMLASAETDHNGKPVMLATNWSPVTVGLRDANTVTRHPRVPSRARADTE